MKHKMKIGWQKYEDMLEKQMSSPMITNIIKNMMMQNMDSDEDEDGDEEDSSVSMMMPISKDMIDQISLSSNFDCWIGHTNFDITPMVLDELNRVPGVEILKVFSRYRMFIGVGRMFDFTDVRKNIEKAVMPKGDSYDQYGSKN